MQTPYSSQPIKKGGQCSQSHGYDRFYEDPALCFYLMPCALYYSNRRNISPYLDKYQMVASLVPLESFLHCSHTSDGKCTVVCSKATSINDDNPTLSSSKKRPHTGQLVETDDCSRESKRVAVPTFDCMSLLKITRKKH